LVQHQDLIQRPKNNLAMDLSLRQETASSSASRIFRGNRPRRDSNESDIERKGPLGLTTVYNPPIPAIADLIFVHGLGGGSQSSWSKNNDPTLFWPEQWLPSDAKFQDVRVHSFGYTSNLRSESVLNINDFAKSLLGAIDDCPLIPGDSDVGSLPLISTCYFSARNTCVTEIRFQLCSLPIVWEALWSSVPTY
jgi:hypothetical protein